VLLWTDKLNPCLAFYLGVVIQLMAFGGAVMSATAQSCSACLLNEGHGSLSGDNDLLVRGCSHAKPRRENGSIISNPIAASSNRSILGRLVRWNVTSKLSKDHIRSGVSCSRSGWHLCSLLEDEVRFRRHWRSSSRRCVQASHHLHG